MPRSDAVPVFTAYQQTHFGEVPRTRFVDWIDAIEVMMTNWPDRTRLRETMREMVATTWAEDPDDLARVGALMAHDAAQDQKHLPLSIEVPSFTFLISGVSRVMTHQIVRGRVGFTYSQKGTANQDQRHGDVLVPRVYARPENEEFLSDYVNDHLVIKNRYAKHLDSGRVSTFAARYMVPPSLAQFIWVNVSLAALIGMVGKRLCTCEAHEYNRVAELVVQRVTEKFPEFAPLLRADCDRPGGCFYQKNFGNPVGDTVHWPDEKHDVGPWNPANYSQKGTREDLAGGPPFETREYVGFNRVRGGGGSDDWRRRELAHGPRAGG